MITSNINSSAQQSKLMSSSDIRRMPAGENFKGIFIVNSLTRKTGKNGRTYWELTVSDQQGSLSAKVWPDAGWLDRSTPELEQRPEVMAEERISSVKGCTIGVSGKTSDYRGQIQYSFSSISLLDQDKYSPARFIKSSELPVQDLAKRFEALVASCRPEIQGLLKSIFCGERWKLFRFLPAAVSNHHVYAHGLLEHTVTVAEAARSIAASYRTVYPSIDIDLVVAGALLHDIGKVEAYVMAPAPEVTIAGAVLDHIALGYAIYTRAAQDSGLSDEVYIHLGHIMLSHHGQKEFGSPVLPATLEALIVSAADELDFRMACWKDSVKDLMGDQQISAFHFAAQRRFWRVPAVSEGLSNADGVLKAPIADIADISEEDR